MSWNNGGNTGGPWGNPGGNAGGTPPGGKGPDRGPWGGGGAVAVLVAGRAAQAFPTSKRSSNGCSNRRDASCPAGAAPVAAALHNGRLIGLLAIVAAGLWLASGIYRVQPDEQGVVLRFGAFQGYTYPGLRYHLPWPIETAMTPSVTRVNRIEVGVRTPLRPARPWRGRPPGSLGSAYADRR